jgi:hypothetical protein
VVLSRADEPEGVMIDNPIVAYYVMIAIVVMVGSAVLWSLVP